MDSARKIKHSEHEDRDRGLEKDLEVLERFDKETFVPCISDYFKTIFSIKQALKFTVGKANLNTKGLEAKTTILVEGEIGSGKSTTLNFIIERYCQDNGMDHKKYMVKYGRSSERVTTEISQMDINRLTVIDSPGTNDIKSELSDYDI